MDIHPSKAVLPNGMIMSGNVVRRNIFYYRKTTSLLYKLSNVPLDHNTFDYNLAYHFGQPLRIDLQPHSTPDLEPADGPNAGQSPSSGWPNGWQAQGQDRHSIVADPLFVDAEKDDYRSASRLARAQARLQTDPD